jgi:ADP-heptose:LPS heptosyltransferase
VGRPGGAAEAIVAGSGGHGRLAPPTTLCELASLLRRARLCVSSDTGPLHLAVAVGTPCVSMHGTTWAERSGPYGPRHVALQKMALDDPLDRDRRTASTRLIEAITVPMVCQACRQVLRRDASRVA